jgi:Major capsid protein GP7
MAALPATNLTLADWAKRIDPQGNTPVIANLLSQTNEILTDCVFRKGNLPTGHRVVVATGLPRVYWRSLNQGILPSKGTTATVDEAVGILEARSEVDKDLASLEDNEQAFRLSEARLFLEAMNQEWAEKLFYGNPASDPKEFLGLTGRYDSLSAGNAQNLISGGGSDTDMSSIWLVVWGDETVFCPFPKGSQAGLVHRDLGEQTVYDVGGVAGTRMQAWVDFYQIKTGLVVKDWRFAVRIHSIDTSVLGGLTGEAAPTVFTNLLHLMAEATYRIPNMAMGRPVFYMNRTCHQGLARLGLEKSQSVLKVNDGLAQFGTARSFLDFLGIPIRRVDALTIAESAPAA